MHTYHTTSQPFSHQLATYVHLDRSPTVQARPLNYVMHNVGCSSTKWPDPFCFLTLSLLCPFYPPPPFPLNPFSHILPSPPHPSLSLPLSPFTSLTITSFSYPFPSHPSLSLAPSSSHSGFKYDEATAAREEFEHKQTQLSRVEEAKKKAEAEKGDWLFRLLI